MTSITEKERLDYAWKHFALIADQRVKTFNFYVIVLLAAFSATISAMKTGTPRPIFFFIGCGHIFIAGIFALIDVRGCRMLAIATDALKEIESSSAFEGVAKLMVEDTKRNKHGLMYGISYRVAFGLTFFAQALFGLLIAWCPSFFVAR
jgi:hypothetical protein